VVGNRLALMLRCLLALLLVLAIMGGQVVTALPDEPWLGAPHDDSSNDVPVGVEMRLVVFLLLVTTASVMAAPMPWRVGIPVPAKSSRGPPLL
jgi:hypothetical protein